MKGKYQYYDNDYNFLDRKEYYERMVFPQSIFTYSDVWKSKQGALLTHSPVSFRELCFGDTPEIISRKFGKPRFVIENHGISSLVFFYKEKINHHHVLTQIHFLGEEFFCACYTFRNVTPPERLLIEKMFFEKYANQGPVNKLTDGVPDDTAGKRDCFIDETGNMIRIFDNVNISFMYLSGHEKVKSAVSGAIRSMYFHEAAKTQLTKKEFFRKL